MATKGVHMRAAHSEGRCSVAYSPDGKQLITSGADTLVKSLTLATSTLSRETLRIQIHRQSPRSP